MALLLGSEKVTVDFPAKTVLDEVTAGIMEGDRIGIVGRNGDGKSTLLTVLAGTYEPDGGRVVRRSGVSVGLLGQTDALDSAQTVAHEVVGDRPEYEWASDAGVRDIISGLLADVPWNGLVGNLSGGQRRRVDLARLLVADWDILMLDEPTNHLDVRAIAWLADHLKRRWRAGEGALLVVTHDRWFLDEVCLSMWEVHDGMVEPFEGGYSAYIQQRVERDRQAYVAERKRQNILRKELAWLARGPQARGTKPKFRIDAARELIAAEPPVRDTLQLKQMAMQRLGKRVIDMERVTKRLGERTVLDDVTWLIGPGRPLRHPGRERRRQDDAFAHPARRARAGRRPREDRPDREVRHALAAFAGSSTSTPKTACARCSAATRRATWWTAASFRPAR